jgi:transposase
MGNTKKRYSPQQKVEIIRELLENQVPISKLASQYHVSPNMIYTWKKQFFEGAVELFKKKNSKANKLQEKVKKLESKLKDRDSLITELVSDNIQLKKNLNGED